MTFTPLAALAIIFFVYAIGDLIATKTKAIISMMLAASIILMVAFWCGLPKDIFTTSGLQAFASVTICMFLVHIGTTIKVKDFIKEWKTVIVVLVATVGIAFGVYFIGGLFINKNYALVGGPTLAGGMVAYLVMKDVGDIVGDPNVAVFALMVLTLQVFAGVPIASNLLRKEGKDLIVRWKAGEYFPEKAVEEKEGTFSRFKVIPSVPEKYNSANLILFKVALVAMCGNYLGTLTGVNQLIWSLILGVIFKEIGFLDEDALTKANGFSWVMAGALCSVFSGLANTTPMGVLAMIPSLLVVMIIGVIVAGAVAILIGKAVKFSWKLSVSVAVTALFGFPGTFLVSREASVAAGETDEEIQLVMDYIMPKMIIGGIVSVSVVSGVLASIMVNWA